MHTDEPSRYLNTQETADLLGVSVSTVKRWVDAGVLPAHRTPGRHRRLLHAEVLALARHGNLPHGDVAAARTHANGPQAAADALLDAMLRGEGADVSAILRGAYRAGAPVEAVGDEVVAPAMARLGQEWAAGRIDVWQEHRATQLCAAALYELKEELEWRAEQNRPVAVGGAPEGDPYLMPALLAQLVQQDAGWEAVNLGPNTPLTSLAKAVRELRPRLVWLSVTHLPDPKDFTRAYRDLVRAAERQGAAIAVGGKALTGAVRSAIQYTAHGDHLSHLAAFVRTLHPRPKLPLRGRPRKA